jgi:hypothetical protein
MRNLFIFLSIITVSLTFSGCYEDPTYGVGIVTVLDQNDFKVPSAEVTLSQQGNGSGVILEQGYTDGNGQFKYTHVPPQTDLAVEVILNVNVQKGNYIGAGIIRIKPNEVSTVDIKIY